MIFAHSHDNLVSYDYSRLPLTRSNFHFPSEHLPSITRTPDNSNFFLFPLKVRIIGSRLYSRLPVTRTLYNSNLPLTRSNFHFPSEHFLYNFTLENSRTPDNSNFFLFHLKVRIIGSRLYFVFNTLSITIQTV